MGGSGFTQTFAELDAAANRLSHLLRSAGLEPGDHIAICMENHDRYLEVVWGCHYAGLVYTCTSSRLQSGELEYILNDCEARAFITSQYKAEQAAEIVANTPGVELRLMLDGVIDGYESYEDAVAEQPVEPLEHRIAGTDMLYSSGTTGRPKGVALPFKATPMAEGTSGVLGLSQMLFGVDDTKIYLSPAPYYHAAPLRFCLATQALGSTVVAMEHFDPEEYLRLVERYHVTHSQVVPTMFIRMLKLPEEVRAKYDVSSLRVRDPRGRSVPGADQEADDRVVRPGDPRVLRGDRGERVRVLQQRHVARPRGHGGHTDRLHRAHRRRGRRGSPAG